MRRGGSGSKDLGGGDNSSDDTGYISHNSLVELRRTQIESGGRSSGSSNNTSPTNVAAGDQQRWDYNTVLNNFRKGRQEDDNKVGIFLVFETLNNF